MNLDNLIDKYFNITINYKHKPNYLIYIISFQLKLKYYYSWYIHFKYNIIIIPKANCKCFNKIRNYKDSNSLILLFIYSIIFIFKFWQTFILKYSNINLK